jgi:NADH:ubiquinone oxidoreductase subunit 4 (subunit M)
VTPVPLALRLALAACIAATLYLGIFPNRVLQYAQDSARQLVQQAPPDTPSSTAVSTVPGMPVVF